MSANSRLSSISAPPRPRSSSLKHKPQISGSWPTVRGRSAASTGRSAQRTARRTACSAASSGCGARSWRPDCERVIHLASSDGRAHSDSMRSVHQSRTIDSPRLDHAPSAVRSSCRPCLSFGGLRLDVERPSLRKCRSRFLGSRARRRMHPTRARCGGGPRRAAHAEWRGRHDGCLVCAPEPWPSRDPRTWSDRAHRGPVPVHHPHGAGGRHGPLDRGRDAVRRRQYAPRRRPRAHRGRCSRRTRSASSPGYLPSAGGMYTYVARGLGSFAGWLMAWAFLLAEPVVPAALFAAFGLFGASLITTLTGFSNDLPLAAAGGPLRCSSSGGSSTAASPSRRASGVALGLIEIGIFLLVSLLLDHQCRRGQHPVGLHPRRRGPQAGPPGHGVLPARLRRLRGRRAAGGGDP